MSALGLGLTAAAVLPVALRSPRLTLLNAALRIDYGWVVGAAALGAALLLAAAAAIAPRRWAQAALVLFAVTVAGVGGARLRYRLEIQPDGLNSRELTGSTLVPWGEVDARRSRHRGPHHLGTRRDPDPRRYGVVRGRPARSARARPGPAHHRVTKAGARLATPDAQTSAERDYSASELAKRAPTRLSGPQPRP